ncbi:MAG: hypothetical protein PHU25_14145 [Deltaproteobacteria bacterium]|nr:hypothetical protein [Deltaproteobacteria bacterium]
MYEQQGGLRRDLEVIAKAGAEAANLGQSQTKASSKAEYDAVTCQRDAWGACYRLLAAMGHKDERVRSLLAQAKGR